MSTSTADANAALVREYLEAIFADNTYREDLLAEDFVAHVNHRERGHEWTVAERREATGAYHAAFPDLSADIDIAAATAETVVARIRVRGTHTGEPIEFDARLGKHIEPTGGEIDLAGVVIVELESGAIREVQWVVDKVQVLAQLGLEPDTDTHGDQ